jgi:hypothetical protein
MIMSRRMRMLGHVERRGKGIGGKARGKEVTRYTKTYVGG